MGSGKTRGIWVRFAGSCASMKGSIEAIMMGSEVGELPKTPLRTTGLNFLAALGEQKTTRNGVNHLEGRIGTEWPRPDLQKEGRIQHREQAM